MPSPTRAWSHKISTVCMRMRRNAGTQGQFSTLNTEHLPPNGTDNFFFFRREQYAKQGKNIFFLLRWALICLRGSRLTRSGVPCNVRNSDVDVQTTEGRNSTVKFYILSAFDRFSLSVVILKMDLISVQRLVNFIENFAVKISIEL